MNLKEDAESEKMTDMTQKNECSFVDPNQENSNPDNQKMQIDTNMQEDKDQKSKNSPKIDDKFHKANQEIAKKLSSVLNVFDWNQPTRTPLSMCLNLKYGMERPEKKTHSNRNSSSYTEKKSIVPPISWNQRLGVAEKNDKNEENKIEAPNFINQFRLGYSQQESVNNQLRESSFKNSKSSEITLKKEVN